MAFGSVFVFFLLTNLLLLHSAEEEKSTHQNCPSFQCGIFGTIGFPFTNVSQPSCGLLPVNCDETAPKIQLPLGLTGKSYQVINISYTNSTQSIRIWDFSLFKYSFTEDCIYLANFTLPNSPLISFKLTKPIQTLLKCNRTLDDTPPSDFKYRGCGDYDIHYYSPTFASYCSVIQLPVVVDVATHELNVTAEYNLEIHVSDACSSCYSRGGLCGLDNKGKFHCAITEKVLFFAAFDTDTGNNTGSNTRGKRLKVMVIATSSVAIGVLMKERYIFDNLGIIHYIMDFGIGNDITDQRHVRVVYSLPNAHDSTYLHD
ncbi:leaf rust 10 disease-resistance locus receptor-like protein kinase-like 1.1 [Quercus suber]|uniref:Leaf rust 10 disease-resistance locus receptor-like protein kinase-like 1.1 n=1 Tax=Quercus suber TaxID=58331 RepID=A0AAW0MAM2_QUESU